MRACLSYLGVDEGVEIHHDGDLPARSGLGSSSAFTVGLLNALYAIQGKLIGPNRLAEEAIHIEQTLLNEVVGIQDQIAAAHGGIKIIEMGYGKKWTVRPMILPQEYIKELESHILLGYSGISRNATDHAKEKIENIQTKKTENELKQTSALSEKAIDEIANGCDMKELGVLLEEGWKLKRRLSRGLSEDWITTIIATGVKSGAYGGKLMGAGGGGFFYFLAPPERHEKIKQALPKIKVWVPARFDWGGSSVIFNS